MGRPFFLFAPGAGAPSSHPWMRMWKGYLQELGDVMTLDYDYMREGRKRPDPLPHLIETHRHSLTAAREKASGPLFLIGKSMGGRVGCHVALIEKVAGVICLGYPLCAAGDRSKLRDQVLRDLRMPILFVQGTRDHLCPLDLLEKVREQMKTPNELYIVEGGDHSLRLTKGDLQRKGMTQEDLDRGILEAIRQFCGASVKG